MKRVISLFIFLGIGLMGLSPAQAQGSIESVSPSSGVKGTSLVLSIRGDAGVVFADGAEIWLMPSELWCTGATLWESNELRCDLDIPDTADLPNGPNDVHVRIFASEYIGPGMFSILSTSQGIISAVAPGSARRGETLDITVTGSNTAWDAETSLSFSPSGISVLSVQTDSATGLAAQIRVSANAQLGTYDLTASTAGQEDIGPGLFTVEEQSIFLSPDSATQGDNLASLSISGGPGNYTSTSAVDLGEGVSVGSFASADGSSLTLTNVVVAANAPVGTHDLRLTIGGATQTFSEVFTVNQGPDTRLLSIEPAYGDAGHPALVLSVAGQNTHFDAAGLDMDFSGEGVYTSHRIDADPEQMQVQVWLRDDAARGLRDVEVRLGSAGCGVCERVSLSQAFEVTEPGQILSVSPAQAEAGEEITIAISASEGHFAAGQTQLFFEPEDGIEVLAIRVTDADHAEADLSIALDALGDPRTVRAVSGPEVAVGAEAFDIFNPSLRSILPAAAFQGSTGLKVSVEAIDVVFDASVQIAFSGAGIVASSPQLDAAHPERFSVLVDVAPDAPPGRRDVTVTQGELVLTAELAFSVVAAPEPEKNGCGCSSGAEAQPLSIFGLWLAVAFVFRRRRA